MNREELLSLCRRYAAGRDRHVAARVTVGQCAAAADPIPEIMRSFRGAEISESEKNALMGLVGDPEDDGDWCAETACVRDPYADARDSEWDDDLLA